MWIDTLISLKKKSGKTIKQIADESGVPIGTLNKLFAGQTKDPKLDTIRAVVYALGFTLDDLEEKEDAPMLPEESTGAKVDPQRVWDLLVSMGFVKPGEDLTDSDLRFLMSVGEIIRAWFAERK